MLVDDDLGGNGFSFCTQTLFLYIFVQFVELL